MYHRFVGQDLPDPKDCFLLSRISLCSGLSRDVLSAGCHLLCVSLFPLVQSSATRWQVLCQFSDSFHSCGLGTVNLIVTVFMHLCLTRDILCFLLYVIIISYSKSGYEKNRNKVQMDLHATFRSSDTSTLEM